MQTVAKPNPASPNADPRDSSLPIRATAMNPPTKIMPTPNTWRTTEYQSKKLKHSYTLPAASDRNPECCLELGGPAPTASL